MNRQVLLASRPSGAVTEANFRIVDVPLGAREAGVAANAATDAKSRRRSASHAPRYAMCSKMRGHAQREVKHAAF